MTRPGESGELTGEGASLYGSGVDPDRQRGAFTRGDVPVAVYGLGGPGLEVAASLAEVTGSVTGVDPDPELVATVQAGESTTAGKTRLSALVAELVEMDALTATTSPVAAAVHLVAGGSALAPDGTPDLSSLEETVEGIAAVLRPGDLVILETTVPPGTTENVVAPSLARESGLEPGSFGVAFAPRRTRTGTGDPDESTGPRIVGGRDVESTRAAALVYEILVAGPVITAPNARTAECARLFEGVYRDVTAALANELARLSDDLGIDVREAIAMANTNPGTRIPDPGPGIEAHASPSNPRFLTAELDRDPPLLSSARSINSVMPAHVVRKLTERLSLDGCEIGDASVGLLGLTAHPGDGEATESPARDVAAILSALGTTVYGVDPYLDSGESFDLELVSLDRLPTVAQELDALVVVTPHREFGRIEWERLPSTLVFDASGLLDLSDTDHRAYTLGSGPR